MHVWLADLMRLDGSSALMAGAGRRGPRPVGRAPRRRLGGRHDGGAWLDGKAARGFACDASLAPVVTGEVDPAALEDLVRLCVKLGKLRHRPGSTGAGGGADGGTTRRRGGTAAAAGRGAGGASGGARRG